jgi:hypothetical protein
MMKCYKYYGASVCDHVHPPIWRATTSWQQLAVVETW